MPAKRIVERTVRNIPDTREGTETCGDDARAVRREGDVDDLPVMWTKRPLQIAALGVPQPATAVATPGGHEVASRTERGARDLAGFSRRVVESSTPVPTSNTRAIRPSP